MNLNELMIGDWVEDTYRNKFVQWNPRLWFMEINGHMTDRPVEGRDYKPIPLTPEILEKNGFEPVGFHRVWSNEEIKGRIEVDCVRDVSLEFWYVNYNNFPNKGRVRAWYVHELQHTLKNAEINRRIVL